jgi:hypothetical protein
MWCRRAMWLVVASACGLGGCFGGLNASDVEPAANNKPDPNNPDDPNNPKPGEPAQPFSCDVSAAQPELPMVRLSHDQYARVLRDVVELGGGADADAVWASVGPLVEGLPADSRVALPGWTHGGFTKLDQAVQQGHVELSLEVAQEVGAQLTATPARLERLVGGCAVDADADNDAACLDDFIRRFGQRVLRGPLTEEDVAFYREVHDASGVDAAGVADVVAVMLSAPQFLYHVEHGEAAASAADTYALSAHELANRLSFLFWGTMPDDALWAAAEDGTLLTDAVYEAQVKRLAADPRAAASIKGFFREWLWLDELPEMNVRVGTPVFDAFTDGFAPSGDLREAMIEEIELMAEHHVLGSDSSLSDLLRSPASFARSPELAGLYGVAPWEPGQQPPLFPAEQGRAGLITRAALLASGSANTRPVIKGFKIRQAMLCVKPPPPPDNAAGAKVDLSTQMSTREVVEAITEQPGTACAGCHQFYMNPLGFATEGFDALGRPRSVQRLFDETGAVAGERPIVTASVPRVASGDDRPAAGAAELTDLLDESGLVHACFARHWVRYTFARPEDLAADGCALEAMQRGLLDGKPLREVMVEVALTPQMKQRRMTEVMP